MADFRERYKRVGFGREDMDVNRVLRSQRKDEARHELRSEHFSLRRDLPETGDDEDSLLGELEPSTEPKKPSASQTSSVQDSQKKGPTELEIAVQQRLIELEKWQKERDRKKLLQKKKIKPVFKVGVVHHRVYSPPLNKDPAALPPSKLCRSREIKIEQPPKRVTRATEKRIAAKVVTNQQRREDLRNKKKVQDNTKNELQKAPLAPKDHQFKAPVGITPLPMFGRLAFEDVKENIKFEFNSTNVATSKSSNDSANSLLTEAKPLKLSSDDQKLLDNQNNVQIEDTSDIISAKHEKSSTKKRIRSTKMITDETTFSVKTEDISSMPVDQEMFKNEENVDVNLTNVNTSINTSTNLTQNRRKLRGHKRSTKIIADETTISEKTEDISSMPVDQKIFKNQENVDFNLTNVNTSINTSTNSTQNRRKLRGHKRSTKIIADETTISEKTEDISSMPVDQKIFKNQENVDCSLTNVNTSMNTSFLNQSISKRFSKLTVEKPTVEAAVNLKTQNILDNLEIIDTKLKTTMLNSPVVVLEKSESTKNRKSIRNLKSKSDKEAVKEAETTVKELEISDPANQEKEMLNHQEKYITGKLETPTTKPKISKQNKTKSIGTRRSTRILKTNSEVEMEKNLENKVETIPSINQNLLHKGSIEIKANVLDSTLSKPTRKSNKRKSTTLFSDENASSDLPMIELSSPLNDQEITGRETIFDFNNKHLLDITLSDLNKFKSPKRRKSVKLVIEAPLMDFQDQSLIKFSPRQSMRFQNNKSKEVSPSDVTAKTTENNEIDQSLMKYCPLTATSNEKLNKTTSSEPTKQKLFDKYRESQNFSLNLTLPEELSLEKPPVFYSPYVITSRGKDNIRKEVQRRRFSQRCEEDIPTKDTVMQTLNISAEDEERTSQYFKYLLDKEIERLNERCNNWNAIKETETMPEDIHYRILAAVGQTQLLINKKFQRFRSLVLDCETGKGEMLVTCKDLQGFWDMMYMEIKDVDGRFDSLQDLKAKNWVEEKTEEMEEERQPKKKKPVPGKKPPAKKKPIAAKSSSIRAHIMAARKKLENKDGEMDVDENIEIKMPAISESDDKLQEKAQMESKKIESTPKNARRTSTPKSLNKYQSLINKQGKKSVPSSPLIAMKLSQLCKTPEVHLDESIIYVNSERTPARSILKATKDDVAIAAAKSTNKVFFKEQPMEIQEFETDKDNYSSSNEFNDTDPKELIERKLDFEDDSFDSSNMDNEKEEDKKTQLRHELYLNKDGIVCERYVPVMKDTPRTKKLRRNNSERLSNSTQKNKIEVTNIAGITTPPSSSKITKKSETETSSSVLSEDTLTNESMKLVLSPRTKKNVKRSIAEAELSENIAGTSTAKTPSPKVKRTPKVAKTRKSTKVSDSTESTATPRLTRTKSLNAADGNKSVNISVNESKKSSLRRTPSRSMNKTNSNENFEKILTPSSKRKSLKVI